MKEAINDILNAYNGLVSEELIGRYILGRASIEETRHLEKLIQDDPFLADAIEGLKEGDFAIHAANLDQIQAALYKKKPNVFKISIASIAIAASVVLVGYWGLRFSNFAKKAEESTSAVAMDSNRVHKETKIITLKEPAPELEELKEKDIAPADAPPVNPQKSKGISSDVTKSADRKEVIALSTHQKPAVSRSSEAPKEYISKDKSYEKKEANILMDEDAGDGVVEEESASHTSGYNASKAEEAPAAPKFVKSLDFSKQALNTQEYLADLAPHPVAQTEEHKSYSLKKTAKPKCDNCIDKQSVAEKNTILDTIATHKAGYLYESGAYEEAARWYARNSDLHSKIMAGVSYLQAGDTSACRKMETVLLKTNTAAAELLKALRMSYLDKNAQAITIYQRLIDNKTVFKELAEKNKQVLSTK